MGSEMKIIIGLLTLCTVLLFSCNTFKLSQSDLVWQPYKVGDILIFASNKSEFDTVTIKNIEKFNNPDDPLDVFPGINQSVFVSGDINILKLQADKNANSVEFELCLGHKEYRCPGTVLLLNQKEIGKLKKVKLGNKDVYKIMAIEFYDNMKDAPYDLEYIYWSMQYGYLGLQFKDQYLWELKSFVREGKEIL